MKLQGPENCGGFVFEGKPYDVDAAGCIEVDDPSALAVAMSHGFAPAPEQPAEQSGADVVAKPAAKGRKG